MKYFRLITLLIFFSILILSPCLARAEWFTDGYLGGLYTEDTKVKISTSNIDISEKENVDESFVFGYRVGHYFNAFPYIGIALDGSYFTTKVDFDSDDVEIWVVPISPLLMLRAPLFMDTFYPNGKWQLYGAIGPGFFISDYTDGDFEDREITIGLDARLGTTYMFYPEWGTFLELRYTNWEPEYSDHINGEKVKIKLDDVTSYHLVLGISYKF